MTNIQLLQTYLRPFRKQVFILIVLLFFSIGLQLIAPQIIRQFLDAAEGGMATQTLVTMGVLFLIVVVVQKGLTLVSTYVGTDLGWAATNNLRIDLTRPLYAPRYGLSQTENTGRTDRTD